MNRPELLHDIIGNDKIKERIKISIDACKNHNLVLDHLLFCGPPGTGKTLLANVVANELGVECQSINGTNLTSVKNILPVLSKITHRGILFIDECHRISKKCQDFLLTALEDYKYEISDENQCISFDIPKFTFIGSTTEIGQLVKPFRDRCPFHFIFSLYTVEELAEIIRRFSEKFDLTLTADACTILARASRGTPRLAKSRVKWLYHYCLSKNISFSSVDCTVINESLNSLEIDNKGLTKQDREYLEFVSTHNPVGISTISSGINVAEQTIEETIEPYLLQQGLILKTNKGRLCV